MVKWKKQTFYLLTLLFVGGMIIAAVLLKSTVTVSWPSGSRGMVPCWEGSQQANSSTTCQVQVASERNFKESIEPDTTPQLKPTNAEMTLRNRVCKLPRPPSSIVTFDHFKLSQGIPVAVTNDRKKCPYTGLSNTNLKPYFNNNKCCSFAEGKSLSQLCGEVNETTLGDAKIRSLPECECVDFMACKMVMLTGVSSDHLSECQDAIASAQNFHPDVKILVYDLGLKECEVDYLNNLRNVQVIQFPFSQYPPHFRDLRTYAWKPYAINMTLASHEIVFWMDASIRLRAPFTDNILHDIQAFPFRALMHANAYNGMTTYDSMYEWFGTSRAEMGKKGQIQSGYIVYRRSPYLYENILIDVLRCVIDPKCIAPPGHTVRCDKHPPEEIPNAETKPEDVLNKDCSRFDQSALSISIHKHHPNVTEQTQFVSAVSHTMGVYRWPTDCFTLYKRE